jgi:hypothetical protein
VSRRTNRIPASEVKVGDVIVFSNGNSLTVATITWQKDAAFDLLDARIIFAGTMTSYSFNGNTVSDGWCEEFWDDYVTVVGDKY